MSTTDPFESFDAAYVLGSLSPEDRQAFEAHLEGCAECSGSVAALAGLPGLLSQVDAGMTVAEPPPGLLPSVLVRSRRSRRRRLAVTVGSLVVAVGACVALAVSVLAPASAPQAAGTAMTTLGSYPVQGNVTLADRAWGTSVAMSCSYGGNKARDYVLVAIGRDGTVAQLATWRALPSDTVRIAVGTALRRGDIQALEVRTTTGVPLLRSTP